ncbi:MAG TPA: prephenate dehydrogenase/arogenate dehydrogenase family protein [Acidimicrobiales bacterium]|nr:prephenate dehydrogenase/arogenate dehydrogenase family protein [Acidimicrobiales bacterium]
MSGGGASRRALVVGTGLIGGSLGLGLRARGWHVSGRDADPDREAAALAAGALDAVGPDPLAELAFVATPLADAAEVASDLLAEGRVDLVVSDVCGVKAPVVAAVRHPRFVGGHPMAGSEQVGLAGADPDLFVGATWVLTPTETTDAPAFARVQAVAQSLGADVIALSPADHDRMVAVVSHVPHLVAATLMNAASSGAERDAALLRLAAGGFRDMTRVSAGHPGIWPDICADNSVAIVRAMDRLLEDLRAVRDEVAGGDRARLLAMLDRASAARRALPARAARPEGLAELRIPVPDRAGVLAEVTTIAGNLGINVEDIEIAHSTEGPRGVLVLVVDRDEAAKLHDAVIGRGYRCTVVELS